MVLQKVAVDRTDHVISDHSTRDLSQLERTYDVVSRFQEAHKGRADSRHSRSKDHRTCSSLQELHRHLHSLTGWVVQSNVNIAALKRRKGLSLPFIHSFLIFLQRLFKSTTTLRHYMYRNLRAEALQATASEGLSKGPYIYGG